ILVGGKRSNGQNFFFIGEDLESISKYKVREERESNQSIVTEKSAKLWCESRLAELATPSKRVRIVLRNFENLVKPADIIEVRDDKGEIIDRHEAIIINYLIDDNGIQTTVECDRPLPNIVQNIKLIKKDIEALQAQQIWLQSHFVFYEYVYYSSSNFIPENTYWDSSYWDSSNWDGEVSSIELNLEEGGIPVETRTVVL
ncbi:MAG: hypothetical protein NC820_07565, partial [Candidatus Omnitrophica bacterium]|nr:hypothetical protein [Candidatus Omnitrophota bacterium]